MSALFTMDPKTTINMIGKSSENTTEVGLRNMASRLALALQMTREAGYIF
jgi:hypothetical protein